MSSETLAIVEELSFHTTKLYNTVNYALQEHGSKSYLDLNKLYADNWHKKYLHSHNYQQMLKVLEKNWKSYFSSLKDFKANPNKYRGMIPQPPKYKNTDDKKNEVIFTNLAVRVKDHTLMLSLSKAMQEQFKVESLNFALPEKVQNLLDLESLQQVRITSIRYPDRLLIKLMRTPVTP